MFNILKMFNSDKVKPEYRTNETFWVNSFNLFSFLDDTEITDKDILSSTANVAATLRAGGIANLDFYAIRRLKNGEYDVLPPYHEINQILKEPNGKLNYTQFLKWISMEYDFKGNSVGYAVKDKSNKLIGIEIIPYTNVKFQSVDGNLTYTFNIGNGQQKTYNKSDVFHLKNLNPLNVQSDPFKSLYSGVPTVLTCKNDIALQKYYKAFSASFLDNNGLPPLILEEPENGGSGNGLFELFEKLKQKIDPKRVIAALPDGMKITALSGSGSAQQSGLSNSIMLETKQFISEAFSMPLGFLSGDNQNKATAIENTKSFYKNSVYPVANEIKDTLTTFFQKQYKDETIEIIYDKLVIQDEDLYQSQLTQDYVADILTLNEVRNGKGYESIEDPEADEFRRFDVINELGEINNELPN